MTLGNIFNLNWYIHKGKSVEETLMCNAQHKEKFNSQNTCSDNSQCNDSKTENESS